MKEYSKETILFGSFYHDIGKFVFRSGDKQKHIESGESFFREASSRWHAIMDIREDICSIIRSHHDRANTPTSIKTADHIAAGERSEDESTETYRPLLDIFLNLDINRAKIPENIHYLLPKAEDIDDIFPIQGEKIKPSEWKPDSDKVKQNHKQTLDQYFAELQSIPDKSPLKGVFNTSFYLASKYQWGVCSAGYKSNPDISLYDHHRMVCSIAMCHHLSDNKDQPFLLIMGDISGIQNFIYNIDSPAEGSSNMAKRLRGRSYYLQLLSEVFATYLLDKMDLFPIHQIYNGGGHFLILAPNNKACLDQLFSSEEELTSWLFKNYHGKLGLVMDYIEVKEEELKDFSCQYSLVKDKIHRKKQRKFFNKLSLMTAPIDSLSGEDIDVCPVCRTEFRKYGTDRICNNCENHVEIGKQLVVSQYLVQLIFNSKGSNHFQIKNTKYISFSDLNQGYFLCSSSNEVQTLFEKIQGEDIKEAFIFKFNDSNFLQQDLIHLINKHNFPISIGYKWLANYAPVKDNNTGIMEFGELAELYPLKKTDASSVSMTSSAYPLLGVLRMDVDFLGMIFSQGIKDIKMRTPARIANLSRRLNLFFSGYMNKLASKHSVYITYSGGDDLFIVGSWINAINFALETRVCFNQFCSGNENLSLSGGLLIVKPNFPIGRAALAAGELEDRAKEYIDKDNRSKDAVALWDDAVSWTRFSDLYQYGNGLYDLVQYNELASSFVYKIYGLSNKRFNIDGTEDLQWFKKSIHFVKYLIARKPLEITAKKVDVHSKNKKIQLLSRLINEPDLYREFSVPAMISLYKIRGKVKEEL